MFGHEVPILDMRSAVEDESFGVREAFKREPELTGYLIKLVLGGALVVSAFSVLAAVLVQALLVFPVVLVMSLIYSVAVLLTSARVVFAGASRRYMETALSSRTPRHAAERVKASEPEERAPERPRAPESRESERPRAPAPPAPVVDQTSFSETYFMLRVQEEVASARRDGREMSLIAIDATVPGAAMNREAAERIAADMAKIAADHHKTISHTLCLSESEYVMSLPQTTAKEAKTFLSNVVQALGNYWCHFGVAVYPDDATSAEGMVNHAREAVEESREGKSKSKKHAVA